MRVRARSGDGNGERGGVGCGGSCEEGGWAGALMCGGKQMVHQGSRRDGCVGSVSRRVYTSSRHIWQKWWWHGSGKAWKSPSRQGTGRRQEAHIGAVATPSHWEDCVAGGSRGGAQLAYPPGGCFSPHRGQGCAMYGMAKDQSNGGPWSCRARQVLESGSWHS